MNIHSYLHELQKNIRDLDVEEKQVFYPLLQNWIVDIQQEYEIFFRSSTKTYFHSMSPNFQSITLVIEYYEDTDFYEFWAIDLQFDNQIVTFPIHWLNMNIQTSKEQFWKEDLELALQKINSIRKTNEKHTDEVSTYCEEVLWKNLQYIYEITSKKTEYFFHHLW